MESAPTGRELLWPDEPLAELDEDRLGRRELALVLGSRIAGYRGPRSFVVGVTGPWGSGKTTFVNFLLADLRERSETDGRLRVVVSLRLWEEHLENAGPGDILRRLGQEVGLQAGNADKRIVRVADLLESAGTAASLGRWLPSVSTAAAAKGVGAVLKGLATLTKGWAGHAKLSSREYEEKLRAALEADDLQLVVVFDDLDRMEVGEVESVFRVIRGIADLPNTVHVLALDREQIECALEADMPGLGRAYVDKFVTLDVALPIPQRGVVASELLSPGLEQTFSTLGIETTKVERDRLGALWRAGLEAFIGVPRDTRRLLNVFGVLLELLRGKVNWVDLFALELIRAREPGVHRRLPSAKRELLKDAGRASDWLAEEVKPEEQKQLLSELRELAVGRWKPLHGVLELLFPALNKMGAGWVSSETLHREHRVADRDHFSLYFSHNYEVGGIPEERQWQLLTTLNAAQDDSEVERWVEDVGAEVPLLADKLLNYLDDERVRRPKVVWALLRAAHFVSDRGFVETPQMRVSRLLYQLLRRNPDMEIDRVVMAGLDQTTLLGGLLRLLRVSVESPGRLGRLEGEEVLRAVFERVETLLERGDLADYAGLAGLLHRWADLGDLVGAWIGERGDRTVARRLLHEGGKPAWALLRSVFSINPHLAQGREHVRNTSALVSRESLQEFFESADTTSIDPDLVRMVSEVLDAKDWPDPS